MSEKLKATVNKQVANWTVLYVKLHNYHEQCERAAGYEHGQHPAGKAVFFHDFSPNKTHSGINNQKAADKNHAVK